MGLQFAIVAFVGALLGTCFAVNLAWRFRILDQPSSVKIHARPVPRIGGVGILLGVLAGSLACLRISHHGESSMLMALLPGAIGMSLVGLLDDIFDLRPHVKFGGQFVVALGTAFLLSHHAGLSPSWMVVSVVLILCACNAVNLLDGLDGLASGVTLIGSSAFAVLSAIRGSWEGLALGLIVAGACAGFLPHNWHRARTFMGDSGSLLLGYALAAQAILQIADSANRTAWFVSVALILLVPAFDTSVAILRRLVNGKPLFRPDKGHIYNQIMGRGVSHLHAVLDMYALGTAAGAAGILAAIAPPVGSVIVALGTATGLVVLVMRLGLLRDDPILARG